MSSAGDLVCRDPTAPTGAGRDPQERRRVARLWAWSAMPDTTVRQSDDRKPSASTSVPRNAGCRHRCGRWRPAFGCPPARAMRARGALSARSVCRAPGCRRETEESACATSAGSLSRSLWGAAVRGGFMLFLTHRDHRILPGCELNASPKQMACRGSGLAVDSATRDPTPSPTDCPPRAAPHRRPAWPLWPSSPTRRITTTRAP